jgi:hypothetical protein
LFSLNQAACFLNVSLDAVVKTDLLVAKNTLSGTPVAKYLTVSSPVKVSPVICVSIFFVVVVFVAQADNKKVATITNSIFLIEYLRTMIKLPN